MLGFRKRMKKRFQLIQNWLKEAEKDYEKNKKTEGELNLLLAQAEVRRAWELSCQEQSSPENLSPGTAKKGLSFYPKLGGVLCLSVFLSVFLAFQFYPSAKTAPSPQVEPPRQEQKLLLPEEENGFLGETFNSAPTKEKQNEGNRLKVEEKEKSDAHQTEEPSPKRQVESQVQPIHQEVSQPIQVDMVDLVEEAQRALYQSGGGKVQH